MKITNISTASSSGGTKKSSKTSGGGGFAAHLNAADADGGAVASGVGAVGALNPLFALQEIDVDENPRGKALDRGFDMLDYLDGIKLSLLDGSISPNILNKLESLVETWRENTDDPDLESVIDEIELRAAVELAKIECV